MSDLRSMNGLAALTELPIAGMITMRGDLATMRDALTGAVGVSMPEQGQFAQAGDRLAAWMSPDELMLIGPHATVSADVGALSTALSGRHHLMQDVSDARALFRLEGAGAREVIAKVCPVDMRPSGFQVGKFRRTRLSQVPCAIWMREPETMDVMAFRSVADYVWDVLAYANDAAAPVGHF